MHSEFLTRLRCPQSGQKLVLEDVEHRDDQVHSGWLISEDGSRRYPIREFIPRFVPESNYADNFGWQWNTFRETQLDSHTGCPISADRFWKATGWRPGDLTDSWVLDVGCGAGRFAEIALQAGARVVALDYSGAVDACYANLRHHRNLHVVQGDVYALPFARESFSFVYSFGVLQHTPDVARAFAALPVMASPGGRLCVDFYEKSWATILVPRYWLRFFTKHYPRRRMFPTLQFLVPILLPISRLLGRTPVIGGGLRQIFPVANYYGILPLNEKQHLEWSLLDTFDWLSPQFDHPQRRDTVRRWLEDAGLQQVEVFKAGHVVGRGVRRAA